MSDWKDAVRGALSNTETGRALRDYASPGASDAGIRADKRPREEFENSARLMNDAERAFHKEMIGYRAGKEFGGYNDPIDPQVMEKLDDMVSKGGKIHPAIQEQYNQVMANPAQFGLKVEENNFIERKMGQGAHDFKPM
jgi:hypothetical protein